METITGNFLLHSYLKYNLYLLDNLLLGNLSIKYRPHLISEIPLPALRIFVIAVITISRSLSQVYEGRARGRTISVSKRIQYREVVKLWYYRRGT